MLKREEALCPICKIKMNRDGVIWFCDPCNKLFHFVRDKGHYEIEIQKIHRPEIKKAVQCPNCGELWDTSRFNSCRNCGMELENGATGKNTDTDTDIEGLLE